MKTIYFVRHGETPSNVTAVVQTPDSPLSERGHRQAVVVAERCTQLEATALIASPMKRAFDTATYISEKTGLIVETNESFKEILQASSKWGIEIHSDDGQAYFEQNKVAYVDGERFEDAENYQDVRARIEKGLADLIAHEAEQIIVVTHGNFLKSMLLHVLHAGALDGTMDLACKPRIGFVDNTGISTFHYNDEIWQIAMWNDKAHFAE